MKKITCESQKGERATFILKIQFRQNASWQGVIQWVEKQQTMPFRSALEMIKLIDSANEAGYQVEFDNVDQVIALDQTMALEQSIAL